MEDIIKYLEKTSNEEIERLLKSTKKYAQFNSCSQRYIGNVKIRLTNKLSTVYNTFELTDDLKELAKSYLI